MYYIVSVSRHRYTYMHDMVVVRIATYNDWKKNLPALCEGYRPKDIFNMDEKGLLFVK